MKTEDGLITMEKTLMFDKINVQNIDALLLVLRSSSIYVLILS